MTLLIAIDDRDLGLVERFPFQLGQRTRVFGVGYKQAAIPTIYPQPHDIAMDVVVTEDGIIAPEAGADRAA